MKMLIISPIAGVNFDHRPGEVVDLDEATAVGWKEAGTAIDAPTEIAAAQELADLQAENERLHNLSLANAEAIDELKGKLADAVAARKGARDELALTQKTVETRYTNAVADATDRARRDLENRHARALAEKDAEIAGLEAQAKELGEQLARATDALAGAKAAQAVDPAPAV